MISKSHYPSGQNYSFTSNKSYFNTKFSKVNDVVFDTKFSQVGAIAEIYEQDLIIYDGDHTYIYTVLTSKMNGRMKQYLKNNKDVLLLVQDYIAENILIELR